MDATIYITDKTGRKFYNTVCGYGFHSGELNNQKRRLELAKAGKLGTIDPETARIVFLIDGTEAPEELLSDEELLKQLEE